MSRNLNTDHVKIAGAAVIWGSSGAFVKYLGLSPGVIAFFRVGIPVMALGIWFTIKRERLFRNGVKIILMASVVNAIRLFFYFIGYLNAPIGNAIIILYAWPVFAVIFSHFFLREPLPCLNQILLFMAMGGIVMVFSDKNIRLDNSVVLGMGAMLISAALNAATVVLFKHESLKFTAPQIVFFQNFAGALIFLPFLLYGMDELTLHKTSVASGYGFLIGVVGYGLFFYALRQVRASTASFLSYLEVISGVLFGVILFHESLSWNEIAGGTMIILSSVLLRK